MHVRASIPIGNREHIQGIDDGYMPLKPRGGRATVGQDSTLSRFTRPSLGEVLTELAGLRSISGYYM
ncbi:MAG: hypothetical protein EB039_09625 [Proteobacteria bacterium]|nr:hypothetical protein [Pseudomonadota bacterium]